MIREKIENMGIIALADVYRSGQISPTEVVGYLLNRIEEQSHINAFITVDREGALKSAEAADRRFKERKPLSILDGIPYGVKDVIDVKGLPTTNGCDLDKNNIPEKSAFAVQRLEEAGAIVLGKTNTSQYALGATGEVSAAGPCRNPYDTSCITGGSSSGSAAAVAAKLCPFALGTDTGGSIRAPAALCGVIGFRPTHGRISANGILVNCRMLDTIGVMARNAEDCAIVLDAVCAFDADDECSLNDAETNFAEKVADSVSGMTVALPLDFFKDAVEPYVLKAVEEAVGIFESLGVTVKKIEMPDIQEYRSVMSKLLISEAYAVHEDNLKNHREFYDPELLGRFKEAESVSMPEYVRMMRKRFPFRKKFNTIFEGTDAVLLPAQATIAAKLKADPAIRINGNAANYYELSSRFLWFTAFAGTAAMSIPSGFFKGLPLAIQLLAPKMGEEKLLRLANSYLKEHEKRI